MIPQLQNHYELVIVTNVPSFYKINLYNLINRHRKTLVFFTGDTMELRQKDFFAGKMEFDSFHLPQGNSLKQISTFKKAINGITFDEIMICGLNEAIHWYCAFTFPKKKNSTVIESSYLESTASGFKGLIKKQFFKRISKAYVSGSSQKKLAENLNFKGKIIVTGGVGVFNIVETPTYQSKNKISKFLYVGRLAPVKNLEMLISVFNQIPEITLEIVGYGPLENHLKSIANSNIVFSGAVDNADLPSKYRSNDVFILPSVKEPWGLVVEEAFNNGLPVILSDRVGCAESILKEGENGLSFIYNDAEDLKTKILKITDPVFYNQLRKNVCKMDFHNYAIKQASCYYEEAIAN